MSYICFLITGRLRLYPLNCGDSILTPPPPPEGASGSFEAEERWWDQVELTRLDLSSNDIYELSEDIENFNSLVTLDVRQ